MNKKAFFFDIDGTLLSEITGQVPESAVRALHQAQEQGHLTFINTGRTICNLPEELKKIPFSGYLCGCGTYISYGDEVLFSRSIPHERGRELISLMKEVNAVPILEGVEDCYFPGRQSRFEVLESVRRYFRNMGIGIEAFIEEDKFDYDKFVVFTDWQTDQERLFSELKKDMDIMVRREGFAEIVPKEYSKATAIQYILEHFEIKLEDAYVFGDSCNDLSMFEYVPHSVAMGVHDEMLKPHTWYVTGTVEEHGVAHAMELILKEQMQKMFSSK